MLKGIPKVLTPEMLKILCEMGHDDEIVIADAHFPAEAMGKRVIQYPCISAPEMVEAIVKVMPLDTYVKAPIMVMSLVQSDIDKGMPIEQVQKILGHSQIDTTMQYAMVNQSNVKTAHQKYMG